MAVSCLDVMELLVFFGTSVLRHGEYYYEEKMWRSNIFFADCSGRGAALSEPEVDGLKPAGI